MTKKFIAVGAFALLTCFALMCAGCAGKETDGNKGTQPYAAGCLEISEDKTYVVIRADANVLTLRDDTSFADYLIKLDELNLLDIDYNMGEYGFYITSVCGIENKTDSPSHGQSWMIYCNVGTLDGVVYSTDEWGSFAYGEETLGSASYGASGLPMIDGYTYALVYEEWSF